MDETSVKYEMSSLFCMDRAFERLMGYVDVDVYSFDGLQTYKEEAVNLAVPLAPAVFPVSPDAPWKHASLIRQQETFRRG